MPRFRHFLISLISHGLLVFLAFRLLSPIKSGIQILSSPSQVVEIVESPRSTPAQAIHAGTKKPRTARSGGPPIRPPLAQLGLPLYQQGPLSEDPSAEAPENERQELLPGKGYGGGGGTRAATNKNYSLYQYLYQRIEAQLTYPSEIREAGHSGTVVARLNFDVDGRYSREQSVYSSSNAYLRVHVIRLVRKALEEAVPGNLNRLRRPFLLNCSFRFAISQHADQKVNDSQKLIVGAHLYFFRSFYKSKLEWELGPLRGLGIFAGGLDPLWFLRKGEELLSDKSKFDPLQKYRDDPEW
jgi:hypothetical protein